LISALDRWARTLGCDEALKLTTLSEAADRLAGLLNDRRALLILDDVWEPEHVRPFHQARGKDCVLVVSTREIGLADALNLQGRAVYNLDVLDEESAVELLSLVAPPVVERFKDDCRLLVRDLEYLPLALHVAGRLLNSELHLGWGVADMLHDLRTGAALLAAKAPADRTDLERQTIPTVAALLRQSTDRLSGTTRECFAYLGPFAPKPAMFDLDSLRSVWRTEDPRPIVRELVSRGLLEPVGGRFRMHALLILHARGLLKEM